MNTVLHGHAHCPHCEAEVEVHGFQIEAQSCDCEITRDEEADIVQDVIDGLAEEGL